MGWFDDNAYPNNPALNQFQAGQYAQPTDTGGQATPGGGFDERPQAAALTPGLAAPNQLAGGPSSGNPTDPAYFRQQLVQWAQQNNRPDVARDPDYWVNAYMKGGGWDNAGNTAALISRIQGTDASGNEPGRAGASGSLGSIGSGSFLQPFSGSFQAPGPVPQFNAPNGLDMLNDPGYMARLKLGTDAIQKSAAAKGTLLTGGTLKDLNSFAQDYASNEFGNVFGRALSGYNANLSGNNQAYNQAAGTFGTNYDIFRNNQNDPFNKLYSLTGLGFSAAGGLNNAASGYGGQLGNNASANSNLAGANATGAYNYGNQAAGNANDVGNANAAGSIAQGNAWSQVPAAAGNIGSAYYYAKHPSYGGSTTSNGVRYNDVTGKPQY